MRSIHGVKYSPLTCVPACGHAWTSRRQSVYVAVSKLRHARTSCHCVTVYVDGVEDLDG